MRGRPAFENPKDRKRNRLTAKGGEKSLAVRGEKGYLGPETPCDRSEDMRIGVRIVCIAVGLLLCNSLTMHGQGFEWIKRYEHNTLYSVGEDVRVSPSGMLYSQSSYSNVAPFLWESGTVIDKLDPAKGERIWRCTWYGGGGVVHIQFRCHVDENLYVLQIIPSPYEIPQARLSKWSSASELLWDTTLVGWYDRLEVSRDRIFLFSMQPDTGGMGTNRGFAVVQFDTLRNEVWRRDTIFKPGTSITRTETYADMNGNFYLTGAIEYTERDVFFLKYDISGNLVCSQWVHGPADRSEAGCGITTDDSGNFYVLSRVDGADNVNSACITKYNPTGGELWSATYTTEQGLSLQSIHCTVDNQLVVGGAYDPDTQLVFIVDTAGVLQWQMPTQDPFSFKKMAVGPASTFYFCALKAKWTDRNWLTYLAKYSLHPVSIETLPDGVPDPENCTLKQNYPNPFNPSTTITFSIPSRGKVRLTVFNHLGREVAVLADGEYHAGTHSCQFSGAELPSGVYMYRLNWSDNSVTRRMVLLR